MQVTCSCGKVLNVPDRLAGKSARCPTCKKVFQVPGPGAAEEAPPKIMIECSCGKKMAAPATAAGKKVLCPKCNKEVTVPAAAKTPAAQAPAIVQLPGAASQKVTNPTRSSKLAAPKPREEASFEIERPSPTPALKAAALPEEPPAVETAEYNLGTRKCPNCKADLSMGAQFCIECGTSLATGTVVKPMAKPGAKKKWSWKDIGDMDPDTRSRVIKYAIVLALLLLLVWWINKPHGMTPEEMKNAREGEKGPGRPFGSEGGGGGHGGRGAEMP